ncbi:pentapeptide repeat-containing protein [Streptomyces sp. NPDC058217]|uniref:pentapeptide repeat-containing protein n=1 Tax=Streptomyces sp. NPDC058217 TaxID=3346384 RepID=UPI0036E830ED
MAIATALPAIPALLALAFTAVTISQAADTLKLSQRDQIASDYNDTVANLGDKSVNVRTSAIFAIQRIMRDSPRDQPALVQILVSYVRDHAKMPSNKQAEQLRKDEKSRPADDVQAALDVLGSRELNAEADPVIDLRNTFLVGATLGGSGFYDADLRDTDLTRADLRDGSFEKVWFDNARMSGSLLSNGTFSEASFTNANLKNVWWDGASFTDADLTGADLTGADYFDQEGGEILNLTLADMSGVNLTDANLTGAYAAGVDFSGDPSQNIPAAILTRTNLTNAELRGAHLKGTDQRTAIWEGANLP